MNRVNLLGGRTREDLQYWRWLNFWRPRALILALSFLILVLLTIGGNFWLKKQLVRLQSQIQAREQAKATFAPQLAQQKYLKVELRKAGTVLQKRDKYSFYLAVIQKFVGQKAVISNFKMQGQTMILQGYWPDLLDLAAFEKKLDTFRAFFPTAQFRIITLQTLTVTPAKTFFVLSIQKHHS